jgi:DNA-binding CsgD family transcriptional regulator/tetratricopeptide (TPR) repeat protein
MLETIREYAGELLVESGEDRSVRAAHAAHFRALAERAFPHLRGADQLIWLDRLDAEHANLRAALRWAEEYEPITVAALAESLWVFWWLRGHLTEGRDWTRQALAIDGVDPATRSKVLLGGGMLAHEQGDPLAAEAHYRESLTLARPAGQLTVAGAALGNLGTLAMERGDLAAAEAFHEESLAVEREVGHRQGVAMTLGNLGVLAWERGDLPRATDLWEECLGLFRELGDQDSVALSLINLGEVAGARGDPAAAERYYEEALATMRELGNRHGVTIALCNLADVVRERGDTQRAATLLYECIDLVRELGGAQRLAAYLEAVARLGLATLPNDSVRLYGAATALREANAMATSRSEAEYRERDLTALRRWLGPVAFDVAWAAGRALPPDEAIAVALNVTAIPARTIPPAVSDPAPADRPATRYGLKRRELEVLRLLVEGKTDQEIADALVLRRGTVSNYVMAIIAKLAVPSRTAAATKAVRDGLV